MKQKEIENLIDNVVFKLVPNFKYRPYQKETILKILNTYLNTNKKYVILLAPTGSGKSWIARIVAEVMNKYYSGLEGATPETLFLTKTISLQNQYLHDFPEIVKLMGASNYSCNCLDTKFLPSINPKFKHHLMCMHTIKSGLCEYNKAREIYQASQLKCLNYAFFFTGFENYFTEGLLVCDEAHSLPEFLIDFSAIKINIDQLSTISDQFKLENYVDIKSIKESLELEQLPKIYLYVNQVLEHLNTKLVEISLRIERLSQNQIKEILLNALIPTQNKWEYLNELRIKLKYIVENLNENWIIEKDENEKEVNYLIKSIYIQKYSLNLLNKAQHVLLMTATGKRLQQDLKLNSDEIEIIEIPYNWDINNRPFIAVNKLPALNYKTRDKVIQDYVKYIDSILDNIDKEVSGIIHTVSYKNAEDLIKLSKHKDKIYLLQPEELKEIDKLLKIGRFIASPALLEGINLENDLSRIQIFMKVPYANLGSKWVIMKKEKDINWYDYETIVRIIQGSGRSIRSENDFAVTYMLDPSFKYLYNKTKFNLPNWFKNSIIFDN